MSHDYRNYGKDHDRTGTSRRNLLGGGYTHYDSGGKKTGTSRESLFGCSYTHYDAKGNKIGSSSEGCYIATCVYGSYDCPEILVLRTSGGVYHALPSNRMKVLQFGVRSCS